jgi:HEAT repeat protein
MIWPSQMTPATRQPGAASMVSAVLLLGPAALLGLAAVRAEGLSRSVMAGVAVTIGLEGLFLLVRYGPQRAAGSLFLLLFYGIAAGVLRFSATDFDAPQTHLTLAATLLVPIALFVRRELATTGGNARRVKFLIRQLLSRKEWPVTFAVYRDCPHIQALRDGLRDDAAPALPLLAHDDVRIQVAVLTALEFHANWRKGQVEAVLQRAHFSDEPAVRAAAVLALAHVTKGRHLLGVLPFLRDPQAEVRWAAAMAVLWDAGPRWPEIRGQVRLALAAPHATKDGPLPCSAALPAAAIDDLVNWSAEAGPVGRRSTMTLVRHCQKAIQEDGSPEAIGRVVALVSDPSVPAGLRVELAHRLQQADAFPTDFGSRLLGAGQPTMLRVLAAGAVLSRRGDPRAIEVLREAARQPNREIALAAASIVQKYLSLDMGLPVGAALPATNSREAADVTRRVLKWATEPGSQSGIETPSDAVMPAPDAAYF